MVRYPCEFTTPHTGYRWLQWASRQNAWHPGVDLNLGIGNADLGNPVYTPLKSRFEYISRAPTRANGYNGGYGWYVVLYHPAFDLWTKYAHLNKVEDFTSVIGNTMIDASIKFAEVGRTGTQSAHLHWELFGRGMYDIQKNYRRNGVTKPFQFYPSGKSKAYVQQYYINPLQFMENLIPSDWAQQDWQWALNNQIVNENSRPRDNMTTERFIVLLKNYHEKRNQIL